MGKITASASTTPVPQPSLLNSTTKAPLSVSTSSLSQSITSGYASSISSPVTITAPHVVPAKLNFNSGFSPSPSPSPMTPYTSVFDEELRLLTKEELKSRCESYYLKTTGDLVELYDRCRAYEWLARNLQCDVKTLTKEQVVELAKSSSPELAHKLTKLDDIRCCNWNHPHRFFDNEAFKELFGVENRDEFNELDLEELTLKVRLLQAKHKCEIWREEYKGNVAQLKRDMLDLQQKFTNIHFLARRMEYIRFHLNPSVVAPTAKQQYMTKVFLITKELGILNEKGMPYGHENMPLTAEFGVRFKELMEDWEAKYQALEREQQQAAVSMASIVESVRKNSNTRALESIVLYFNLHVIGASGNFTSKHFGENTTNSPVVVKLLNHSGMPQASMHEIGISCSSKYIVKRIHDRPEKNFATLVEANEGEKGETVADLLSPQGSYTIDSIILDSGLVTITVDLRGGNMQTIQKLKSKDSTSYFYIPVNISDSTVTRVDDSQIPFKRLAVRCENMPEALRVKLEPVFQFTKRKYKDDSEVIMEFLHLVDVSIQTGSIDLEKEGEFSRSVATHLLSHALMHDTGMIALQDAVSTQWSAAICPEESELQKAIHSMLDPKVTTHKILMIQPKEQARFVRFVKARAKVYVNCISLEESNIESTTTLIRQQSRNSYTTVFVLTVVGKISVNDMTRIFSLLSDVGCSTRVAIVHNTFIWQLLQSASLLSSVTCTFESKATQIIKEYSSLAPVIKNPILTSDRMNPCYLLTDSSIKKVAAIFDNDCNWRNVEKAAREKRDGFMFLQCDHQSLVIDHYLQSLHDNLVIIESDLANSFSKSLPTVVVIKQAQTLLQREKEVILSKLSSGKHFAIFLTSRIHPHDLSLSVYAQRELKLSNATFISPQLSSDEILSYYKQDKAKARMYTALSLMFPATKVDVHEVDVIDTQSAQSMSKLIIDRLPFKSTELSDFARHFRIDDGQIVLPKGEVVCQSIPKALEALGLFIGCAVRSGASLMSFEYFSTKLPLSQFLSQRSKISCWTYCLHKLNIVPFYITLDKCLGNNVDSQSLLSYFQVDAAHTEPAHLLTPFDGVKSKEENLISLFMAQKTLDYEQLQADSLFPYSVEFLTSAFAIYAQPLRLIACSNPLSLYTMLQVMVYNPSYERAFSILINHLEDESISNIFDNDFKIHVAILKWFIFIKGIPEKLKVPHEVRERLKFNEHDVKLLLDYKLRLSQFEENAKDLIPIIFSLDGPSGIIISQVELQDFCSNADNNNQIMLVDTPPKTQLSSDLGAAFVEFITNRMALGATAEHKASNNHKKMLTHPFTLFLQDFIHHPEQIFKGELARYTDINIRSYKNERKNLDNAVSKLLCKGSEKKMIDSTIVINFARLSPKAVALLLSSMKHHYQVYLLAYLISVAVSTATKEEAAKYLCSIMASIMPNTPLKFLLLNLVFEQTFDGFENLAVDFVVLERLTFQDKAVQATVSSILLKSLKPFYEEKTPIPIAYMATVRSLFVASYSDKVFDFPNKLEPLQNAIMQLLSEGVLSKYTLQYILQTELLNPELRGLLMIAWALCPESDLNLKQSEVETFKKIVNNESFGTYAYVQAHIFSVSTLALFLVFPYLLDYQTLNTYLKLFGEDTIDLKQYVVCQKGLFDYPPYTVWSYMLKYPEDILDRLAKATIVIKSKWLRKIERERLASENYKENVALNIFTQFSVGVSPETIGLNINALINSLHFADGAANTMYALQTIIWKWLYSFGFDDRYVFAVLKGVGEAQDLQDIEKYKPDIRLDQNQGSGSTIYPFQSFLNIRLIESSSAQIFGNRKEDVIYTLSLCNAALATLDLAAVALKDCLIETGEDSYTTSEMYNTLAQEVAQKVGTGLQQKLRSTMTSADIHTGRVTYDLLPIQQALAPFVFIINQLCMPDLQKTIIDRMIWCFLEAQRAASQTEQAIVHRSLQSLLGISNTSTSGFVHYTIFKYYGILELQKCMLSCNELAWCVQYGVLDLGHYSVQFKKWSSQLKYFILPNDSIPALTTVEALKHPETKFSHLLKPVLSKEISEPEVHEVQQAETIFPFKQSEVSVTEATTISQLIPIQYNSNQEHNVHMRSDVVFEVHELMELRTRPGYNYAELAVRPGQLIFLVKTNRRYKFIKKKSGIQAHEIVLSFHDHNAAWSYLDQQPTFVAVLTGIIIRKENQRYETFTISPENDISGNNWKIMFWNILFHNKLLKLEIPEAIEAVLYVLLKELIDGYVESLDEDLVNMVLPYQILQAFINVCVGSAGERYSNFLRFAQRRIPDETMHCSTFHYSQELQSMVRLLSPEQSTLLSAILQGDFHATGLHQHHEFSNEFKTAALDLKIRLFEDLDNSGATRYHKLPKQIGYGFGSSKYLSFMFGYHLHKTVSVTWRDAVAHNNEYTADRGLTIGFMFASNFLAKMRLELSKENKNLLKASTNWITNMLRSSLDPMLKADILRLIHGGSCLNMDNNSKLDYNQRIMLHALSKACRPITAEPFIYLGQVLDSIAYLNPELENLAFRCGNEYGIHIVSQLSSAYTLLKSRYQVDIELIDITEAYHAQTLTEQSILTMITEKFLHGNVFVYVRGLLSLTDKVLKWCSEYTKRNPCCYIYFEGVETIFFLPENRDRYRLHETQIEVSDALSTFPLEYQAFNYKHVAYKQEATKIVTAYNDDWVEVLTKKLQSVESSYLLIEGAPGIGKTQSLLEKRGTFSGYIIDQDGSSDELVKCSFIDILARKISACYDPQKPILLIVDEFHMLSTEQKVQLVSFVSSLRSRTIQLIMISNRFDQEDRNLLESTFGKQEKGIVRCKGVFKNLMAFFLSGQDPSRHKKMRRFFEMWIRVTRGLFGEELMSYRFCFIVQEWLSKYLNQTESVKTLANHLKEKVVSITSSFALALVEEFIKIYKEDLQYSNGEYNNLDYLKPSTTIIQLLIRAALADNVGNSMSYPELCCTPQVIENIHLYHPVAKMFFWIHYLYSKAGCAVNDAQCEAMISILSKHPMIDIPLRFPQIQVHILSKLQHLKTCPVLCKRVNPLDIKGSIIPTIQKGYSVQVNEIQRAWKENSITDPELFEKLVSVYPPAIRFLTQENLGSLVKNGKDSLAEKVINYIDPVIADPNNCYYIAAWKLYRSIKSKVRFESGFLNLTIQEGCSIDLVNLLLWASKFAFNMVDISGSVTLFESNLQLDLGAVSKMLLEKNASSKLVNLWSFIFAPYANVSSNTISYSAAFIIAKSQHPPARGWDKRICHLCDLWWGMATPTTLAKLYEDEDFWKLITDMFTYSQDERENLITNMIKVNPGPLSTKWQVRLLTNPRIEIPNYLATDPYLKHFEAAVKELKNTGMFIAIQGLFGDALNSISRQMFERFSFERLEPNSTTFKEQAMARSYHFIFLIDISGSMANCDSKNIIPTIPELKQRKHFCNRLGAVYESLLSVISARNSTKLQNGAILGSLDRTSIVLFNDSAKTLLEFHKLSHETILNTIVQSPKPSSTTAFTPAITQALSLMEKHKDLQPKIILLTDGHGEYSESQLKSIPDQEQKFAMQNAETPIFNGILFGSDKKGEETLESMCRLAKGSFSKVALDLEVLKSAFTIICKPNV